FVDLAVERVAPFGHETHDDVAVGDDADELAVAVDDRHDAGVLALHDPSSLDDAVSFPDARRIRRHDVAHAARAETRFPFCEHASSLFRRQGSGDGRQTTTTVPRSLSPVPSSEGSKGRTAGAS